MRFEIFMAVLAALVLAATCGDANAGPFGRRTVTTTRASSCESGACGSSSSASRTRTVTRGHTGSAQGVAEICASEGRCAHHGGNSGYEGVGGGPTPEAALRACCNNGGAVVDQGVAQGRDGRWYACRRYGR